MKDRQQVLLSQKELEQQKEYRKKAAAYVARLAEKLGHAPYAMVVTYGCQQNENDSEKIKGMLQEMGYQFTTSLEEADLILYNTCAVRENAELKVFGNVGALTHYKRRKPSLLIGLCGCMMQQPHVVQEIRKKYKHVDMVFGTHTLYRLGEILYHTLSDGQRTIDVVDMDGQIAEDLPVKRDSRYVAWVSIMYGCNNFCSYCIVPYVRGRERSREPKEILAEVRQLVESGVKDITLLGQNVNSYGKDLETPLDFPDLLRMVNDVPGDFRIRFMTSHPKDAGEKLFLAMRDCEKVAKHLHLPFQSGSNRILKEMNRRYTREDYLSLIRRAKELMPGLALTSDIIVGFPGETYEDFKETISLIEEVQYDSLFTFLYSKRVGTPAATMENQVDDKEKHRRFDELLKVQEKYSKMHNDDCLGKTFRVLVEGPSKNNPNTMTGKTDGNKTVNFEAGPETVGTFQNVTITEANTWSLFGKIN